MNNYSLESLHSMMKFDGNSRDAMGTLNVFIPAFNAKIKIQLNLIHGNTLLPRSVMTINNVVNLSDAAYHQFLKLLYEDAMRARDEVGFVDTENYPPRPSGGFIDRLLGREKPKPVVMLAQDDPRHPCFLEDGINSVESNVEWLGFRIDEHTETHTRLCLLDCVPQWEDEHGVTLIIRNGVPVATGPYDVSVEEFDTI